MVVRGTKLSGKQKGAILAAIGAAASIILGASGVDWGQTLQTKHEHPEIIERVHDVEIGRATNRADIQDIKEDVEYIRRRLDNFIDNKGK